jgi:hypothetical protein
VPLHLKLYLKHVFFFAANSNKTLRKLGLIPESIHSHICHFAMNCTTTVLHLRLVGIGLILQCGHHGLRLRMVVKTDVSTSCRGSRRQLYVSPLVSSPATSGTALLFYSPYPAMPCLPRIIFGQELPIRL